MTDEELNRIVEAKLADRLAARKLAEEAKLREEIAAEIRREETKKWHDRVNQRHPCEGPYAGLTREQHEERLRIMSERAAQANREMDAANSKVVDGSLKAQRAAAAGGRSGFRFK
jgi:hypothetical protein